MVSSTADNGPVTSAPTASDGKSDVDSHFDRVISGADLSSKSFDPRILDPDFLRESKNRILNKNVDYMSLLSPSNEKELHSDSDDESPYYGGFTDTHIKRTKVFRHHEPVQDRKIRKGVPQIFRDEKKGRTISLDDTEVATNLDINTFSSGESNVTAYPMGYNKEANTTRYMRICAPMVRYSKLAFRELVSRRGCDITYTPMILSDVYKHSTMARSWEFLTNSETDNPVVVQFASAKPVDFVDASILVAPHANGVDLNCGCPQPWAFKEKIGSFLMESPQTVYETIREFRNRVNYSMEGGERFPIGIKIRIHDEFTTRTADYVRGLVHAGADWISIHGRHRKQKNTEPVNLEAIRDLVQVIRNEAEGGTPIVANGDIDSIRAADRTIRETLADGVMSARGLLSNPDVFYQGDNNDRLQFTSSLSSSKLGANTFEEFHKHSMGLGGTHFINHHHLMFMTETSFTKADKQYFNVLPSVGATVDYLDDVLDIHGNNNV